MTSFLRQLIDQARRIIREKMLGELVCMLPSSSSRKEKIMTVRASGFREKDNLLILNWRDKEYCFAITSPLLRLGIVPIRFVCSCKLWSTLRRASVDFRLDEEVGLTSDYPLFSPRKIRKRRRSRRRRRGTRSVASSFSRSTHRAQRSRHQATKRGNGLISPNPTSSLLSDGTLLLRCVFNGLGITRPRPYGSFQIIRLRVQAEFSPRDALRIRSTLGASSSYDLGTESRLWDIAEFAFLYKKKSHSALEKNRSDWSEVVCLLGDSQAGKLLGRRVLGSEYGFEDESHDTGKRVSVVGVDYEDDVEAGTNASHNVNRIDDEEEEEEEILSDSSNEESEEELETSWIRSPRRSARLASTSTLRPLSTSEVETRIEAGEKVKTEVKVDEFDLLLQRNPSSSPPSPSSQLSSPPTRLSTTTSLPPPPPPPIKTSWSPSVSSTSTSTSISPPQVTSSFSGDLRNMGLMNTFPESLYELDLGRFEQEEEEQGEIPFDEEIEEEEEEEEREEIEESSRSFSPFEESESESESDLSIDLSRVPPRRITPMFPSSEMWTQFSMTPRQVVVTTETSLGVVNVNVGEKRRVEEVLGSMCSNPRPTKRMRYE